MKGSESSTGSETRQFFQHPTELAWESFVDRYGKKILLWCRGKGLNSHDSQNVVQEVLMRIHSTMQRDSESRYSSERGRLRPWLRRVTINAVNSYFSGLRSDSSLDPAAADQLGGAVEDLAEQLSRQDALETALVKTELRAGKKWPPFQMRFLKQASYEEITAATGFSYKVAQNYVSLVRKIFVEEWRKLTDDGDSDPLDAEQSDES